MPAGRNREIARAWLDAFNAHDTEAILALYDEAATHTSPKIRVLHPETDGKLVGKDALRAWWGEAFVRLPGIRYEATALTADDERVFLEYLRHAPDAAPMPVAEVFRVVNGRIVDSRVYHG